MGATSVTVRLSLVRRRPSRPGSPAGTPWSRPVASAATIHRSGSRNLRFARPVGLGDAFPPRTSWRWHRRSQMLRRRSVLSGAAASARGILRWPDSSGPHRAVAAHPRFLHQIGGVLGQNAIAQSEIAHLLHQVLAGPFDPDLPGQLTDPAGGPELRNEIVGIFRRRGRRPGR